MEHWQLKQLQSLPLEAKIEKTKIRIKEWYEYWDGNVYVSFSGGKDSTVLLDIVRSLYPNVVAVFVDTGLEYPEIRQFVKTIDNVTTLKPKTPFTQVIKKHGYPIISKEQSQKIREARHTKSDKLRDLRINGRDGKYGISKKWLKLINAPFEVSEKCCNIMKKNPFKLYEKTTSEKSFIGTMASDSDLRQTEYLRSGCNSFDGKLSSKPLSFWNEKDIWNYIKINNIPYSKIYDMGYERTGCMFCMFGVHLEKSPNRFQRMKQTHPKQYDYCINTLGIGQALDYIGVDYKTYQNELFKG